MAHTLLDDEQAKVFDLINQLEIWGIHHILPLPQLIVCGGQSSGKSSLLSAISGFDFPVRFGKCTRFPIQVVLKRTSTESSDVSIIPGEGASAETRARLTSFKPSSTSLNDLRKTVEEAQLAMDLGEKFSSTNHVLRVEISGPTRSHLTLVDLPGLTSSTRDGEPQEQIEMIERLVETYMASTLSIILAVIPASDDADNQRVLNMVKSADPTGARTIAVVTKPDLKTGPGGQNEILSLVQNKTYRFELGWHIVRNIDRDTFETRVFDRSSEEAQFFSQSPWNALPRDQVGVPALLERLSRQLCRHISKEIPKLTEAIQQKLSECTADLRKLGEARGTSTAQRIYLSSIAERFQLLVGNALAARYQDTILSEPSMQLRARVRALQDSLYFSFKVHGSSLNVSCNHINVKQGFEYAEKELKKCAHVKSPNFPKSSSISCEAHTQLVENGLIRDSRGRHLPTLTDPGLLWEVFRHLSLPWSDIVNTQLELMFETVSGFVNEAFRHFADENTHAMLRADILDPALDRMKVELEVKKCELMAPYTTFESLSWNPTLLDDLVTAQLWSFELETADPVARAHQIASLRLVHQAYAYYRTAQCTVVDNIANLAVENCLLNSLRIVFRAGEVAAMNEDVLSRLAGEPEGAVKKRKAYEAMKTDLSKALKLCREYESVLGRRVADGANRAKLQALNPGSSPAPSSVRKQQNPKISYATPQRAGRTRSLSADLSRDEAGIPPLTPNCSVSPQTPRLVTPKDDGSSPAARHALHKKAYSIDLPFKVGTYVAPHVSEAEEEL